jgi:hypothetical protein
MMSHALPMDPIFRPTTWLPDWLKVWATSWLRRHVERREAPRKLVANLTAHYWEGTGAAGHRVRDISTSGAFIYADFKWMPGTIVTMTLRLEDRVAESGSPAVAVARAKVIRHAENGVGVQFLWSDKNEQTRLATFVQSIKEAQRS